MIRQSILCTLVCSFVGLSSVAGCGGSSKDSSGPPSDTSASGDDSGSASGGSSGGSSGGASGVSSGGAFGGVSGNGWAGASSGVDPGSQGDAGSAGETDPTPPECLIYTGNWEGLCSAYCGPVNHCADYLLAGLPVAQPCESIAKALTGSTPTPGSSTAQCACNTNSTTIRVAGIDCESTADVCNVACLCFGGVAQTTCGM